MDQSFDSLAGDESPTLDPLTVYCPACNEAFLGMTGKAVCPRCGMNVTNARSLSLQTVVLNTADLAAGARTSRHSSDQDHMNSMIGTELDRYHLESFLGKGGMGWVYLARHLQLDRPCAVKILSPSLIKRDPEYLERFYSEGQAAAAFNHQNIVTIHAIGACEDKHFLEMEFVPGRSLQKVLSEHTLHPSRAGTIALGIAEGLAVAHRKGIVHRDLKPDNVMLTHAGIPKIADFGLAKRLHGRTYYELPGTLAGTPHYMAPEIFAGENATPASDVYALGVTLFVMLTGQTPFSRPSFLELASAVQHDVPPNLRAMRPDVPLEMCECVARMMEKSPGNRPQDGIEASLLLQATLGQEQDLESLLHTAFAHHCDVRWKRDGDRFRADVSLDDGRKQTVFVETSQHAISDRLLQIYSLCCPADERYHAHALRLNSQLAHGAVALRKVEGKDYFVTLNNYPRGTVDPDEIRRSVLELAEHADAIEHMLTGEDRN